VTPRPMSELEWLGWEVAAARYALLYPCQARLLRVLVQRAPAAASWAHLANTDHPSTDSLKSIACQVRAALREIGLATVIESVAGYGYRMDAAHAARIQTAVENWLSGRPAQVAA
jgi:DNA-binding winged helix-turn-helix (wHTH) protein